MRARTGLIARLGAVLLLAACAPSDPHLMNPRSTTGGPDEFSILPPKALEMPKDLAALPPPTPGGANLTDVNPADDAIVALGGKVPVPGQGYPAADKALVAAADKFGAPPADIRQQLAAADLKWRQTHQGLLLQRWFNLNVYYQAYQPFALNQYAELEYWRSLGVATPSAPPNVYKK